MKMKLPELQDNNNEIQKLRSKKLLKDWKKIKEVLNYEGSSYVPKVICSKLISKHYNNLFIGYYGIEKI